MIKYYYADPMLVAKKDASGTYWYHADHLGSTRLITDINGQNIKSYDYAAFGDTVSETGSGENQRGFTGHMSDPEIGLIYMGARYYDATLGRFISADSIVPDPANPQAFNRYSYVYNNPISNTDPTGHAPVAVAVITAVGVTAAELGPVITATAWIGAGITTVGYFTEDPVLSTIGGVMLGFSGGYAMPGAGGLTGGILGASVAAATSPLSPLDPNVKEAIGWAYTAYGLYQGMGYSFGGASDSKNFFQGIVDTVIGENYGEAWGSFFTEEWVKAPTGGYLPESMAEGILKVRQSIPRDLNAAANGMHAWHAATNAFFAKKLGLLGAPLILAGGVFHETPLDWGSFLAEQRAQGTVNHFLDSFTDIGANVFGMAVGYMIPGPEAVENAMVWGNYIPGPGEPLREFGGRGGIYRGNPSDAWWQGRQYP